MRLGVSFELAVPFGLEFRTALDALPESAERLAVRLRIVMPIRAAVADMATNANQRRPARLGASVFDCVCERVEVVGVLNRLGMPSVGFEPFAYVFGESDLGVAVDRDVIVVVEVDDVAKAQMARDRCRLARDALHHVAVAGDRENLMVEQ